MNMIAKPKPGAEYLISDLIATSLTRAQFEKVKAANPMFDGYKYYPAKEVDFSWWNRISKKLTTRAIYQTAFYCDYNGKVTEV